MKGIPALFIMMCIALIRQKTALTLNNNPAPFSRLMTEQIVKCEKTQYTSLFTRCQIDFDYCNATSFSFLNCFKKQCERYVRGSECRLWTKIQLTESQCYKQCCGSTQFSEQTCSQFNDQKQETQQSITGIIIGIIVVSAVVLVGVTAYLLIKVQNCLKKGEMRKISKYNIFWRNQKAPDSICQLCKNYGAFIQTPCNHYFHASCFEENTKVKDLPLCPTCQNPIKQRVKISCTGCKQKIFKIKLWRIEHLPEILKEARALHEQLCVQTARSDQHLLSPAKF